jgi:hypothetical protein
LAIALAYRPSTAFDPMPKDRPGLPSSVEEAAGRLAGYLRRQLEAGEHPALRRALVRLGVADVEAQGDEVVLKLKDGKTIELEVKYYGDGTAVKVELAHIEARIDEKGYLRILQRFKVGRRRGREGDSVFSAIAAP